MDDKVEAHISIGELSYVNQKFILLFNSITCANKMLISLSEPRSQGAGIEGQR